MKKVLFIGAGFLQSFLIKKAKEMGYFILAVDANPSACGFLYADKYVAIDIVDQEECLKFAKENNIDGVITAATEFGVLTCAYIAENMHLPGISCETAKLVKNKYQVLKHFLENNVDDSIDMPLEIDETSDINELDKNIKYPVIVKPSDGSGSRGVSRVNSFTHLKEACSYALENSICKRAVVESFIDGQEYGAECLVSNGQVHVLSIMKKWMTEPPYYAELGHAIPSGLPKELENKVKNYVEKASKALGIDNSAVNADILISKEGKIYIIDIGARMGGNMIGPCIITYGTGIDYMAAIIETAVGDFKEFKKTKPYAVISKILAFPGGKIERIPNIQEFEKEYDVELYHHFKKGHRVNEYHTNLDSIGYLIAKDTSLDKAEKKVLKAYQSLSKMIF